MFDQSGLSVMFSAALCALLTAWFIKPIYTALCSTCTCSHVQFLVHIVSQHIVVGQSVEARFPVDHASVEFVQACSSDTCHW